MNLRWLLLAVALAWLWVMLVALPAVARPLG
jgi:hypothetical protein